MEDAIGGIIGLVVIVGVVCFVVATLVAIARWALRIDAQIKLLENIHEELKKLNIKNATQLKKLTDLKDEVGLSKFF